MGDGRPQGSDLQHPPIRLLTSRQIARKALLRWPLRRVPVGSVGVTRDVRAAEPSAATVLPPGWHLVRNGRLAVVAAYIDTGEWPVSAAPGAEPVYWIRAICNVDDPRVAAFAVADVPTAIVQQLRGAVRAATSGDGSLASGRIAAAVRELLEPILHRWGVSIRDVTVKSALS